MNEDELKNIKDLIDGLLMHGRISVKQYLHLRLGIIRMENIVNDLLNMLKTN